MLDTAILILAILALAIIIFGFAFLFAIELYEDSMYARTGVRVDTTQRLIDYFKKK